MNRSAVLLLVICFCLFDYGTAYALKCDRIPEGAGAPKSRTDGRYRIRIEGSTERYIPSETYSIYLSGIRSVQATHKFTGFMIGVESDDGRSLNVGEFQLMGDTIVKFSERCPNLVTHTSSIPKTEVQVRWTAPPPGSGCVWFRATVIEHRDVWYMDDHPLSKKFCEEEQDTSDLQPRVDAECCACQEAKYEVTFEGLWSRHTHPKDYPSNRWLTRFSDIIGASHTVEYRFWEYGQAASEGLQQVAEHGSTRQLETELKSESQHIRTIIKARGIAYPNVTGKTFAVFRVDSRHHLVSLVSQIDPSPDWIVGVSGLELCQRDCTWVEQKTMNLYPWDAGTDSGPSYTSPNEATYPKDLIRRIKSDTPNDPRSPFYDANGQDMKPMARIYFTRQRLYDKNCDARMSGGGGGLGGGGGGLGGNEDRYRGAESCATTPWGPWGNCKSECGAGTQHRQRKYLSPNSQGCNTVLTERKECYTHCPALPSDDDTNDVGPECELTEWSAFSKCSKKCGKGVQVATRMYRKPSARQKCERGTRNPPPLQRTVECDGSECGGDITERTTDTDRSGETDEPPRFSDESNCKWSAWSMFSPCNRNCDQGNMMRYRYPQNRDLDVIHLQMRAADVFYNMDKWKDRKKILVPLAPDGEPYPYMPNECNQLFCFEQDDPCLLDDFMEFVECEPELPSCTSLPELCFLQPEYGACRDYTTRWAYDSVLNTCSLFSYSGCDGNDNRFNSKQDCIDICKPQNTTPTFERMKSGDHRRAEDCVMSPWERGHCNASCGEGTRRKVRRILSPAQNGGRPCPKKLVRMERCRLPPCESSRYDTNPLWGPGRNW